MVEKKRKKEKIISSLRAEAAGRLARTARVFSEMKEKTPEALIHELQVHQIEIEMQNEELKKTQLELEETRDKFIDLYDFAPVGYFTFTRKALIKEVNLTGAALLGMERQKLINARFRCFIVPEDYEKWDQHLLKVFGPGAGKQTCDLKLRKADGPLFNARIESICIDGTIEAATFRTAMSDVSERKMSDEKFEHLATFPQLNPNPVIEIGASGVITFVNPATLNILQELGLNEDAGIFLPADLDIILNSLRQGEKSRCFYRETDIKDRTFAENIYVSDKLNVVRIYAMDITERKLAEEALQQSREDLSRAQEVGNIGSWRLDVQRNVLTWSDENHRIFGIPKGTPLTYEAFLAAVHPEDRKYVDTQWNAGLRGEPYDIEHRVVADGLVKWVREKAYLEFDEDGSLLGGFGITQDITKRKQAEETIINALAEAQQRQAEVSALLVASRAVLEQHDFREAARSIFDSCKTIIGATAGYVALLSDDGTENEVLFLDSGGLPCSVNPSLPMPVRGLRAEAYHSGKAVYNNAFSTSKWMGNMPGGHVNLDNVLFAPLQLKGKAFGLLGIANKPGGFTEGDAQIASAFGDLAAIALHNSRLMEALRKSRNELELRVQERTADLVKANKELESEIAERRHVEDERTRLVAAVECAHDAVAITDTDWIVRYVNPAFVQITDYSREEIIGQSLHILRSDKHDDNFYNEIWNTLKQGRNWSGHLTSRKKDGNSYEEDITFSPVKDSLGNIGNYVSINRDITDKLRLESIAEAVNTMNNIGYVFAGLRHEIGNPINSIKMTLGVLKRNFDQYAKADILEYIERALSESARVEYLLKTLKNFNMYETPDIQNINIRSFLDNFSSLVKGDLCLKKGIDFSVSFEQGAEFCYADPRALQQILLNICNNAADALEGRPGPRIEIKLNKLSEMILIRVKDNGAGMPREVFLNLFKPFYTTKQHGTGLGLVIVKKMLAGMNGIIEVWSEMNIGTTVDIMIPEAKNV